MCAGSERAWNARVGAALLSLPRAGSNVGLHSALAASHAAEMGASVPVCGRHGVVVDRLLDENPPPTRTDTNQP